MLQNTGDNSFEHRIARAISHLKAYSPVRFKDVTLDGVTKEYRPDVEAVLRSIGNNRPGHLYTQGPERGLFMSGDVGTGKSAILRIIQAYLYANSHIAKTHRQIYYTHVELVADMRFYMQDARRGPEGDPARHYAMYAPYLIIDELGGINEDRSGWNLTLLEGLINERWEQNRTTFVATNKTGKELREWPGWSRIVDRLADPEWNAMIATGNVSRRK